MKYPLALLCVDTATGRARRYERNIWPTFGAVRVTDEFEVVQPCEDLSQLKIDLEYFRMFRLLPGEQATEFPLEVA